MLLIALLVAQFPQIHVPALFALTFTGDISLGNLAIVITLIGVAVRIGMQIGQVQSTNAYHSGLIAAHTLRLDRYELKLAEVVGQMQRMIGRLEATQDRIEKKTGQRPGEGPLILDQ